MKKLNKIRIIEAPRENILDRDDLFELLGGDNCGTFNECGQTGRNSCSPRDTTACNGGGANDTRCSSHTY